MNIREFELGMEVKIICWGERPEHWSSEMDHWQGKIVTISNWDNGLDNDTFVYIEEDGGEWTWQTWDFELYNNLSKNNPNVLYRHHKNAEFFAKMREKHKF